MLICIKECFSTLLSFGFVIIEVVVVVFIVIFVVVVIIVVNKLQGKMRKETVEAQGLRIKANKI